MRYGRQPIGAVLALTTDVAEDVMRALGRIVEKENGSKS